jgi:hypothetical protein
MADKAIEKARVSAVAGRLAHLRAFKFETVGFKSNEPIPSLATAHAMHAKNKRAMSELTKTPSVTQ